MMYYDRIIYNSLLKEFIGRGWYNVHCAPANSLRVPCWMNPKDAEKYFIELQEEYDFVVYKDFNLIIGEKSLNGSFFVYSGSHRYEPFPVVRLFLSCDGYNNNFEVMCDDIRPQEALNTMEKEIKDSILQRVRLLSERINKAVYSMVVEGNFML